MKFIELSKGKVAIVDDEDYKSLSIYKWSYNSKGYAWRSIKGENKRTYILMHRFIMGAKADELIDHKNGNRLDNRKCNLRICTRSQNNCNQRLQAREKTSKFKGLTITKSKNWQVQISFCNNHKSLGTFTNEIAGANAYNYYAKKYHGEFACLNDVPYMEREDWEKYRTKFSSKYLGVIWNKQKNKWQTRVYYNKKMKHIGFYDDEDEAGLAYNEMALSLLGKNTRLNEIEKEESNNACS